MMKIYDIWQHYVPSNIVVIFSLYMKPSPLPWRGKICDRSGYQNDMSHQAPNLCDYYAICKDMSMKTQEEVYGINASVVNRLQVVTDV